VVEECIKLLSETMELPEHEEAEKEGRWWSKLLVRASKRLASEFGESKIEDAWTRAFNLHVWGFHEKALAAEHVGLDMPYVEWLVDYRTLPRLEKARSHSG
jgi:hypothetical protein